MIHQREVTANENGVILKGHLGLGDPGADLLHGDHGAVQPGGEQELLQREHPHLRHRLHRRRHLLHRYNLQLPHFVRRPRRIRHCRGDKDQESTEKIMLNY